MKSQISKAEAEKDGQGQLGEASCAELLDTVLQTAVSLLSREVSWSHTCFVRVTVGSVEGSVGQEGGGIRGKKYTLAVSSVAHLCPTLCDPMDCSMLRLPCPSPTPGAYSNSCLFNWWCHPTISSSVIPCSSHLKSFPASGSFQMGQFFCIRWPKYWCFNFSFSTSNECYE